MSSVTPPPDNREETVDLLVLLAALAGHWRWIVSSVCVFSLLALLYTVFTTPVWQAGALIQVEQKQGNLLFSGLTQALADTRPTSAPEMALLKSRMILGQTVDELGLQVTVTPETFPVTGRGWSRLTGREPPVLQLSEFSRPGKENVALSLTITVQDGKHYRVNVDGAEREGITGQPLSAPGVVLTVAKIDAPEGTRFTVTYVPRLVAISTLQKHLTVTEQGRDSGMLSLALTGEDPRRLVLILNSITRHYLAQNVRRQAARDEQSLAFLEQKLPEVRASLDAAEDRLSAYRQQNESVDLSLEAKSILEQIVNVDNQLNALTFREADISRLYRKEHPVYRALQEKRDTLRREKARLNSRVSAMPSTQQAVLSLSREVETGRLVYQQLLNRQQELDIARAGVTGNVRVIDEAVTYPAPVWPRKTLTTVLGGLLGLMASAGTVLVWQTMHRGIASPAQLEEAGITVYASIPYSRTGGKRRKNQPLPQLLAMVAPQEPATEALRSLRTSLHFAMMGANNILMISGASPGAGKTFISSNLALVMARAGKKVLLIDADLRRGYLHQLFGRKEAGGLSDVLSGRCQPEQVKVSLVQEGFDYIGRGPEPAEPAELLMQPRLGALLELMSSQYDLVIIDTPPVLAVTDASVIGRYAGTVLLVARMDVDTVRDMVVSVKRFERNGVKVKGCVLNGVLKKTGSSYRYGAGYYGYAMPGKEK
ncbi:polysaccharide biosynthesis tyrosine autokinase [Citrobacter sedlakii]|uniref:polysaccharide biosynthesis tyrosine autokinase n=1 Tax=Citrobacter sedlakii TaxID=67826 RepID=UPI0022B5C341|nr:polysaccharide biosynthesis tyrosine autokinase [Citrobacter sedlakii]MCZ4677017.1 polysaccharide biosynthesis tyrosine autokinase [Citrobacter sedlakii]MDR5007074.1 polysaccharide biosynthesis tyrosine autokinase [Citrobacter sedlakii]